MLITSGFEGSKIDFSFSLYSMKMQLFESLTFKFEQPNWAINPVFGLLDAILDAHPEILMIVSGDIIGYSNQSEFGRKDIPSVEQIFRAALYKEMRGLDYRELDFHQEDSRVCAQFIKIDELRPYSFQMYQKYISRIKAENLERVMILLNKIAINEGIEDIEKLRQDSTVVETNIHYPTNNSLVWDCIKESHRLLLHLAEEIRDLDYRDYTKAAKKTFFKINNTKSGDRKTDLFIKQLIVFTKCINQVCNVVKKREIITLKPLRSLRNLQS